MTSQGSVTASWLWEGAPFIKQKSKQQERNETKNIITPPMENNVPIGYIHPLIYYIIILSVSLIFAHYTFKKMLGC